jgi:hypothetical protein
MTSPVFQSTCRCADAPPDTAPCLADTVACCQGDGSKTDAGMQARCMLALLKARASITRPQLQRVQRALARFNMVQGFAAGLPPAYREVWAGFPPLLAWLTSSVKQRCW